MRDGWTGTVRTAWQGLGADGTADRLVEHAVVLLCAATLAVACSWLLLSLLVCGFDAVRHGAGHGRSGLFRPRLVRALVSAVAGAVVATCGPGAATAGDGLAGKGDASRGSAALPLSLDGLALPDRTYGGVRHLTVHPGDSLWSITADLLPPTADPRGHQGDRSISQAWPRLHRLNRHRLGTNPHLIHPGTRLRLPAWAAVPNRGASR